ncbi:MAG: GNAT family N-acetyltransferase [Proteobacteria bacterium]|nr:GNAT family N-acetyltransferase [Pseudomonadota bacterium]
MSRQHSDATSGRFEICPCGAGDSRRLREMYDRHYPEAVSQGLPPTDPRQRTQWLDRVLGNGESFLVRTEEEVVGHCALVIDPQKQDAEVFVFVARPFRRRGLGAELLRAAKDRAAERGLGAVWLTVETHNYPAVKLYRKMGFIFCDHDQCEREMVCRL